jgi:predicted ATP-grasp superfamily ATP-dependent carboligase
LKAQVGYRQLRDYPAAGGQATLRVSVRHEKAEAHFRRLLEELGWHGPCQGDFIVDSQTDVPYLIDINPRLWGSLTQAIASGVDFPYLIYRLAKDGDIPAQPAFKADVVTRWIGGELAALPWRLRHAQSKFGVLRDFVFPAASAALYDDFSLADPMPFAAWSLDAVHRALKFRSVTAVSHDSLDGIWE